MTPLFSGTIRCSRTISSPLQLFNRGTSFITMAIRPISEAAVEKAAASIHQPRDPNTLANYNAFRTKHTTANLEIDFHGRRLKGHVELTLAKLSKNEDKIILDSSYVDVASVQVDGEKAQYDLAPSRTEPYGTPLSITLDSKYSGAEEVKVNMQVETTKDCTALQWMDPSQTSNKKHPYMFSQCQAIHARSIFPCQDTPDVKSTFTFNIRSPLPVLASGLSAGASDFQPGKEGKSGTLLYKFEQDIPMPSYLFAIASGDLACASIGPRSTVWTGPEELVDCKWEFEADTEKFIEKAEKIVYPYAWGTYNILILPPSFPYGGMENPYVPSSFLPPRCLVLTTVDSVYTFATPTVVSGDRQNVDVIAHELSHSWSGNLVSNASWEHFWLNEGWTTYLERRLQAASHGDDDRYRSFSALIGWKALSDSIENFGEDHEFTKLIPDLKGKDPDDAFSSIPYEKGFTFLYHLEGLLGKEKWDTFIPHYFKTFRERSLDSYEFKATLLDFFASDAPTSQKLNDLDWDAWFYKPGFPPKPAFDTTLADQCYALASKWEDLASSSSTTTSTFHPSPSDIETFTSTQLVVFLETLQSSNTTLPPSLIEKMAENYSLTATNTQNIEILSRFYVLGLRSKTTSLYEPTAQLLGKVGRMKFVRPMFRELLKVDSDRAKAVLRENEAFYHPICRGMMEKMVEKHGKGGQ